MLLTPLHLLQTVTPSWTSSPLERNVLYGRPHVVSAKICIKHLHLSSHCLHWWIQKFNMEYARLLNSVAMV